MAITDWKGRALSADDAVWIVKSGMNVFVHGAAATPTPLVEALARRDDRRGASPLHTHTPGPAALAAPGQARHPPTGPGAGHGVSRLPVGAVRRGGHQRADPAHARQHARAHRPG